MRLGEILLERGKIDAEDLERALELQQERGDKLGKILVDMGLDRPARRAGRALAINSACRWSRSTARRPPRPKSTASRTASCASAAPSRSRWPIVADHRDGRSAGFRDHRRRARLLAACEVRTVLAAEQEILDAIDRHYGESRAAQPAPKATTKRPAPISSTCATWRARRRSSAWSTP